MALALIMALNSAVAAYYYLKLIVYMFLKDPIKETSISFVGNSNNTLRTVIGISALITITSMAFIDPLLDMINYYVAVSGY
jgi:NADH-quinone oxidoreductase subunit N